MQMQAISAASTQVVRQMLEPMRKSMCESLTNVHMQFTTELARMQGLLYKSETRLLEAQRQCALLQEDNTRLRAERDHYAKGLKELQVQCASMQEERARLRAAHELATKTCETLKVQHQTAIQDMQKMNDNIPKLVLDYYQLKSDHATLQQEAAALRDANAQLREKVRVSAAVFPVWSVGSDAGPASPVERKETIKTEGPSSPVAVKQERERAPDSPSDLDTECALGKSHPCVTMTVPNWRYLAIAKDHEARKRRQREAAVSGQQQVGVLSEAGLLRG